jgi:hypothetical protein
MQEAVHELVTAVVACMCKRQRRSGQGNGHKGTVQTEVTHSESFRLFCD